MITNTEEDHARTFHLHRPDRIRSYIGAADRCSKYRDADRCAPHVASPIPQDRASIAAAVAYPAVAVNHPRD
jgi:hypothetical protein